MMEYKFLNTSVALFVGSFIEFFLWRLATGWTVRGSNPGGSEVFRTRPDRRWDPPSFCTMGTGSLSRG